MPQILIVKTSSLGDVIHHLPVLADILMHRPEVRFDWVVEEGFTGIPALHPTVDRVIPVAMRRWRRALLSRATWHEIAACRALLQAMPYDLIIDAQGLLKSAIIARQARGVVHGQDRASAREPLAAAFYDVRHAVSRGQHAVARNRQLAALSLGYALPDTPPDYGIRAPQRPLPQALPEAYLVGLHASSRDSKRWPDAHWVALSRALAEQGLALLLPWGTHEERARAEQICAAAPNALVLPRLSLAELATLLAGAVAAVGVDTGLVHLAAALGVTTVAIYTDTDPALTGVCAGRGIAVNLGGIGRIPQPAEVMAALDSAHSLT